MEFVKLDYQKAYDAHRNTSFSPEKRAVQIQEAFHQTLKNNYDSLRMSCHIEEQKTVLLQEWERFQQGLLSKYNSWLSSKSRCASSMITGPSNFPVRRMEKANRSESNRYSEIETFRKRAYAAIMRKIKLARTTELIQLEAEAQANLDLKRLSKDVLTVIGCMQNKLPYNPTLIKDALARRLKNVAMKNPNVVLSFISEANETAKAATGRVMFTDRHKIFTLINNIKTNTEKPENKEPKLLYESKGIRVINNFNDERVQILFDDKPDVGIRNQLKGSAFRWSPRNTAWQRKNTYNGLRSALCFAQANFPAK